MGDGQGQRGSNRKLPKAQHLALAVDEVDELLARVDVGFHFFDYYSGIWRMWDFAVLSARW